MGDDVLIRLITVANMAGVEQASKGLFGLSGPTIAAGAALGLLTGLAGESVHAYVDLADKIENYKRVTGASAEESSRMVEAFQVLGVDAETATAGMFKLAKAVELHSDKLRADGVVVAKNADGTTNLAKTLGAVADAYNAQLDPAKKNQIVLDAFGKAGAALIPILEQGSQKLAVFEDEAGKIFTQDDLDRAKRYGQTMREAGQNIDDAKASFGDLVAKLVGPVAESFNRGTYIQNKLNDAVKAGIITQDQLRDSQMSSVPAVDALTTKYSDQFDKDVKLKAAAADVAQALKDQAKAERDAEKAVKDATDAMKGQTDADLALATAERTVHDDATKVTDAYKLYLAEVKAHGQNSVAAKNALDDYNIALLQQRDDIDKVVIAVGEKAVADDIAAGKTQTASDKANAMIGKLQALEATVKPGSPLYAHYEQWIAALESTPAYINTNVSVTYSGGGYHRALAAGGHVAKGETAFVGEEGPEQVTFDDAATVHPAGGRPGLSSRMNAGGARGGDVHVHIDGGIFMDGPSIDRLANLIIQRVRFAPGT